MKKLKLRFLAHGKKLKFFIFLLTSARKKLKLTFLAHGKKLKFFIFLQPVRGKSQIRSFLGYSMNILLTWMIMQRLLPLKQISTHHFNSLDTCYNWILGYWHFKAGNFGECWIFSTEVLTKKLKISFLYYSLHFFVLKCIEKKLKFFIFVLTSAMKKLKLRFLAHGKKLKFFIFLLTSARKKLKLTFLAHGKKWKFFIFLQPVRGKSQIRSVLGYRMNILLTWMIMQRLLPLKQISTHHFNSLDTCYNGILGCCHLKAGNFGECWNFSTEVLIKKLKISFLYCSLQSFVLKCIEKKLKFFIFVLTGARKS